jgi:hypothetical protein
MSCTCKITYDPEFPGSAYVQSIDATRCVDHNDSREIECLKGFRESIRAALAFDKPESLATDELLIARAKDAVDIADEKLKARLAELEHAAKISAVQADWDSRCIEEKKVIISGLIDRLADANESLATWEQWVKGLESECDSLRAQLKEAKLDD